MRLSHVLHRIEQQMSTSGSISKALENLNSGPISRQRVQIRMKSFSEQWEEFDNIHKAILIAVSRLSRQDRQRVSQHPYLSEDVHNVTRECYLETLEKMSTLLDNCDISSSRTSSEQNNFQSSQFTTPIFQTPRLPRIELPKFNGTLSDWLPFKDLFSSLVVNNPSISAVEKLQYLKTSLIGSASQFLKNTSVTSDNFLHAWDSLIAFYENERLLVHSALQSLFSLKKITRESSSEIENLYTTLMQNYRTLESLKRPIQYWDDILVFLSVQRLDFDSVRAWEQQLGSSKKPPTWNQFKEFLMTRMLTLQAYEKSHANKPSIVQSRNVSARVHVNYVNQDKDKSGKSCFLCKENHFIANCQIYKSKPVKQRINIISERGLCYNCLGTHRISLCPSTKRCLKCGKKHHSTIHETINSGENKKVTPITRIPVQSSSSSALTSNQSSQSVTESKINVPHI